jgi:hypothetical protein
MGLVRLLFTMVMLELQKLGSASEFFSVFSECIPRIDEKSWLHYQLFRPCREFTDLRQNGSYTHRVFPQHPRLYAG